MSKEKPKTEESAAMIQALEIVAMIENIGDTAIEVALSKTESGYWSADILTTEGSIYEEGSTLHAALTAAVAAKKTHQT